MAHPGISPGIKLFNIVLNGLDGGAERTSSQFAADQKAEECLLRSMGVLLFRETWAGWRNGATWTSGDSTAGKAKPGTCGGVTQVHCQKEGTEAMCHFCNTKCLNMQIHVSSV